jgi:hypothetical protein
VEPPGLKTNPGPHDERCLNCRFMAWRDSKPVCGKFDFPVLHWYFCDDWESDGKFAPIKPMEGRPVRIVNRENHGE